jgi:N-glycosylase/DNA lyase
VGPKVAQCVLLYGFGRAECVPVDVWIRRALDRFYPNGIPPEITPVAGLGQQYLFHYVRHEAVKG